jgi:hypothetical protein
VVFDVALKFIVPTPDQKLFNNVGSDDKRNVYLFEGTPFVSVFNYLDQIMILKDSEAKNTRSQALTEKNKIEAHPFAKTLPKQTAIMLWFT